MPDKRQHRGPHPEDARLFAPVWHQVLRQAVYELSWLLTRGYAQPSAVKLVGDRHNLTQRQRLAIMRCACSEQARLSRLSRRVDHADAAGQTVLIDTYNVLTTIEVALAGGVVLGAVDTCYRDMASIHGTWRKVEETRPALVLAGKTLAELGATRCVWYLDKPVSNSGRLAAFIRQIAEQHAWPWQVEIVQNPDAILADSRQLVVTADSAVLDRCGAWLNLARRIVIVHVPHANLVDLCVSTSDVKVE